MTDPENIPEPTHEEVIADLAVDMPEVKEATPDAVNEADRSTELETPTEATSETTHTPPSPDHLAFLNSLPTGEYGLSVQVYADRVEEDGLFDAAHVLRHHDAYLEYPKRLFALHRSICSQIERIFGCRYAPGPHLVHSPLPRTFPEHPHRLYIREQSLQCFRDWPLLPDGTSTWDTSRDVFGQFRRDISGLSAATARDLTFFRRTGRWYEVSTLPLLLAHLSGMPTLVTGIGSSPSTPPGTAENAQ